MEKMTPPIDPIYRLILSFPDQSNSFALGFAAGKVWAEMKRNEEAELSFDVATENREVIYRMAECLGWEVECRPMTGEFEGWDSIALTKIGAGRQNPHGLRIVRADEHTCDTGAMDDLPTVTKEEGLKMRVGRPTPDEPTPT